MDLNNPCSVCAWLLKSKLHVHFICSSLNGAITHFQTFLKLCLSFRILDIWNDVSGQANCRSIRDNECHTLTRWEHFKALLPSAYFSLPVIKKELNHYQPGVSSHIHCIHSLITQNCTVSIFAFVLKNSESHNCTIKQQSNLCRFTYSKMHGKTFNIT